MSQIMLTQFGLLYGIVFSNTFKTQIMNKKPSSRGRSQDRAKVAGGQNHEVNYEKEKLNVSGKEVKDAVRTAGNSRKKVEEKLRK
jgi:hypothetical protein